MNDEPHNLNPAHSRQVEAFLRAWGAGQRPRIETYLAAVAQDARPSLFAALMHAEFEQRVRLGERPDLKEYERRFPDYVDSESVAISSRDTRAHRGSVTAPVRTFHAGVTPATDEPKVPAMLGRYDIRGVLGRGGFGTVYLGYDDQLEREVAIKTSRERHGGETADPAVTESWSQLVTNERFLREARRVARLRHPGIASVHDVGVDVGHRFIVSDRIDGTNLRQRHESKPSWREAGRLVRAVADALSYAHAHHIVHRDVKPENIMVTPAGDPVLVDFGLAIDMGGDDMAQWEVIGSLPYMSPEQLEGKVQRLDGRTDIYSLGVVLYELLSGQYPYTRVKHVESTWNNKDAPPRPLTDHAPDVPRELRDVCMRALARSPDERYATAHDMVQALDLALGQLQRREALAPEYSEPAESWVGPERRQIALVHCVWPNTDAGAQAVAGTAGAMAQPDSARLLAVADKFAGALVTCALNEAILQFMQEDAASQAVLAALDIVALGSDGKPARDDGASLPRVAVVTGMAEVRDAQPELATALVEQADALNRMAAAGSVTTSHDVYKLVRNEFECVAIESDGDTLARTGWRVEAPLEGGKSEAELDCDAGALVGRAVELELLSRALQRAQAGDGQVLLIGADAGFGKSRLLGEFHRQVAASALRWTTCRCLPQHENSALYPLIDWLRRAVLDEDGADAALALERLEDLVVEAELPVDEVVPVLAPLIPLDTGRAYQGLYLTPERRKQVTLEAFVMLILAAAEQTPGVLVVEDLHWLDPTSVECLDMLIEEASNSRLLLVMTYRPTFVPPWPARPCMSQVALTPLNTNEAAELARRTAGAAALPAATLERVIARTDGVPLFIEEMTRAFVEAADENDTTVTPLPATLQASLQSRLDRLGPSRELAQCAAVIGQAFTLAQCAAVSGLPQRQCAAQIDQLVRAGLLQRRGRGRRLKFVFRHTLMLDAAYAALAETTRRDLHLQVAQYFLATQAASLPVEPEVLAHHFTQAQVYPEALAYWREAGEHAAARSANVEAASHYRQALALVPHTDHHDSAHELELLLALAAALAVTRGYAAPELEAVYARAYALGKGVGAYADLFQALRGLWQFHSGEGRVDEARRIGGQLLEMAERSGDKALRLEANRMLGNNALWTGDFATARARLERAVALYEPDVHDTLRERFGQDSNVANRGMLALALALLGEVPTALAELDAVVAYAQELEHPFSRVFAYGSAMWVHKLLMQPRDAREWALRCADVAQAHSFAYLDTAAQVVSLWALACEQPEHPDIDDMDRVIDAWRSTGATNGLAAFYMLRAETLLAVGRPDAAALQLAQPIVADRSATERWLESDVWRLRGQIALALHDDRQGAMQACQRALAVARAQTSPLLELRALMAVATLELAHAPSDAAQLSARQAQALVELRAAVERFAARAGPCGIVRAARALTD